ncbi:unnamed protein product [Eruca vesicaria subsp. sativa]|uniref:Uncharacterized protein n=1 Tax=Eruca vesicaria subsp. sativa TaxID=29727 RepID=A0ABC8L346_ERUVS|nr:unnamed protein product [Eruca vesicaria subsp. sativa]
MEELRDATYRYTNHPDPKEREARIQRVFDTEAQGLMETTAAKMAANESAAAMATCLSSPAQQIICFRPEPGFEQSTGQELTFSREVAVRSSNAPVSDNTICPVLNGPQLLVLKPTRRDKMRHLHDHEGNGEVALSPLMNLAEPHHNFLRKDKSNI